RDEILQETIFPLGVRPIADRVGAWPTPPDLADQENALGVGEWERAEQHRIHHTEDRGRGADAEPERQHHGGRERRALAEGASREAETLEKGVHNYSARSAGTGSRRAARRAGPRLAGTATASRKPGTPTKA